MSKKSRNTNALPISNILKQVSKSLLIPIVHSYKTLVFCMAIKAKLKEVEGRIGDEYQKGIFSLRHVQSNMLLCYKQPSVFLVYSKCIKISR